MAHKTGFTEGTLREKLLNTGFRTVNIERLKEKLELRIAARK